MTYEELLERMLDLVPDELDKREGSIIYTALAPIAAQLAEQQIYDDTVMDTTMPDTAGGSSLTRKCAMFGVQRKLASHAVRLGVFHGPDGLTDVPEGARFGAENILYAVSRKISVGNFELVCQQSGRVGNQYFGAILPIDSLSGLEDAALSRVLIPGEDEEKDDALRARFYERMNSKPFGGNVDQYRAEILVLDGVHDVAVFPTPENQGGHVHCVIVAEGNTPASDNLVKKVQELLDPDPQGKGNGIAPIGHWVTVSTVVETAVDISAVISVKSGYTLEMLQTPVEQVVAGYLSSLAFGDSIIRLARVESAILNISGIADISGTLLCGKDGNITLPTAWNDYQVPVIGTVTLTGVP